MAELKRILLVEDNPNDVELTLAALAENRLANEVVVARDGEAPQDRRPGARQGEHVGEPAGRGVGRALGLGHLGEVGGDRLAQRRVAGSVRGGHRTNAFDQRLIQSPSSR